MCDPEILLLLQAQLFFICILGEIIMIIMFSAGNTG